MTVTKYLSLTIFPIIIGTLLYYDFALGLSSIIMFLIGILFWNVFEYLFHRFAFHNSTLPRKVKRYIGNGHRFHHRYPENTTNLLLPVSLTLPFSLLSLLLIYLIFGANSLGWYYFGLISGMLHYEIMHYAAHHLKINSRYFKFMKHYHLKHHFKEPNKNFMVSNPLFDYLFTKKAK